MRRPLLPLFAAGVALVLPTLFITSVAVPSWTGRHALLVLEAAVGLPVAFSLLRTQARRATAAGVGFAAWALLSFVVSSGHTTAFWGLFGWGTGALFVLALVACWAIGTATVGPGARWIENALLAAAVLNAALAVLQSLVDLGSFQLDLVEGRPAGLLGNPVFLGAFLAGAVWLVALRPRALPATAALVLLAAAVELSGSRLALGLAAAAVVAVLMAGRGTRPATIVALCLVAGALLGAGIGRVGNAETVTGRGEVSSGIRPRAETWLSARHAIAADPLLGAGPGRFRAATSQYRTLKVVRAEGPDRVFNDAHNLVVEYAVTTGLPGLALLFVWVAFVVRRTGWRTPLAGFGLVVLATHLLQPQNVVLTPLAFLALGAAAPLAGAPPRLAPAPVLGVLGVAAAATAVLLLVGSFHLRQARLDFGPEQARQAHDLLPAWSETDSQLAQVFTFLGKAQKRPDFLARGRAWRQAAAARDPSDARLWNDLAGAELDAQLLDLADTHYRRALLDDPWSVRAMNGLAQVALARRKPDDAIRFWTRSLRAAPNQRGIKREIEEFREAREGAPKPP